jgi:RNA polymerase sigma-70 factor (ECF subfamily)
MTAAPPADPAAAALDDPLQDQVASLFERLRLPVCRYLTVVLGRTGEAEELTQEAFIRLYGYLRAGHPPDEARFWIFRIAHNLAANVLRRRRFTPPMEPDAFEALCRQLATTADPEGLLVVRDQRRRLIETLVDLSPQERRCLALRAEGLRYREIADVFGISYAAAVDSARRAIRKLSRAIQ